jgi:hypothetical protein
VIADGPRVPLLAGFDPSCTPPEPRPHALPALPSSRRSAPPAFLTGVGVQHLTDQRADRPSPASVAARASWTQRGPVSQRAGRKSRLLPIDRLFEVHDPVCDLIVGDGLDRRD